MNKIQEIKLRWEEWKAALFECDKEKYPEGYAKIEGVVFGLDAALHILKRPSNTRMHVDTKPCAECEKERKNYPWPPFCKWCGRSLSQ